ncbi:hypothetical protein LV192_003906 [Vibrio mimicus]
MKARLLGQFFISAVITLIFFGVIYHIIEVISTPKYFVFMKIQRMDLLMEYYSQHIRGNLFAGLIAVGGFLMTGKTFILVTMKQNVFDDQKYIETHEKLSKFNSSLQRYAPLIELKDILYLAVYMTVISAIIQLTVGLIPHWIASMISIFFAIWSIVLVIDSLNLIKRNLDYWLNNTQES